MHRDVKLGLALGILVIGFAAAFCFPRQPAAEIAMSPTAGLKLAAVDQEIRLERRRTFVGDELNPPEQPTLADPLTNSDLPPLQTAAMRAQAMQRSAPDPIRRETPPPADEPLLAIEPSTTADTSPVIEAPVEETYYTVQSGDTLSAVASKTLGSARKYEVIYEANRDVMATPNSLRIGMKLRIPQEAESVAKRSVNETKAIARRAVEPERSMVREPDPMDDIPVSRSRMFSPAGPSHRHAVSGDSIRR
ncbi:MAG TPA: LysM peptidoglycan-binding domain-containing protein [Caulifigura sp.]|jgi:LysM repeat protein|nr:LysM peptidoglycan-binding domain-containing protein [Caulifigura sp.]